MNSEFYDFSDSLETEEVDSFVRNIEQLEEATSQLKKGTITSTRIAFLLIHNILDLLTYEFTKYTFWREQQRLPAREMFEYLSDFNNRIKYLSKKNVLNEEERDILKVFHYIRNESYHTGAIKSRVLPSVTRLSHNKVCELLKLLSPPLFDHKYSNNYVQNSVDKYSNEFKIGIKDLAKELSKDLLIRIKSVLENLSIVCLGNIEEREDETQVNNMLIWVQSTYWDETILGLNQVKNFKQALKVIETAPKENIDEIYSNHYTYQKIKTWRKQALNLEKTDKCNKILMVWKEIDEHLSHIELMLEEASIDIDDWIDWSAEELRGR
jgi:cell fate (sporulation/competence/biofilm development) regulator YmcA (YheA/YmcA/DUF963 family)